MCENKNEMLEIILERFPEENFLIADGFNDAIIGMSDNFTKPKLIYSVSKCIEILEHNMDELDVMEYFDFNVAGAYVGEQTPIWCYDNLN